MKIFKYKIGFGCTEAIIPGLLKVLDVQFQEAEGSAVVWCMVDESKKDDRYLFDVYGTGHNVHSEPSEYVGTWQHPGGTVWHLFLNGVHS